MYIEYTCILSQRQLCYVMFVYVYISDREDGVHIAKGLIILQKDVHIAKGLIILQKDATFSIKCVPMGRIIQSKTQKIAQ